MQKRMLLSQSLEDYLEAIFHIEGRKHAARAKDISARLHVKSSSTTGALRSLAEKGLVNYAPYDIITLTDKGEEVAKGIVRRHETLKKLFVNILLVDEKEADEVVCKMEHALSRPMLEKLILFIEYVETCPLIGEDWIKRFEQFCEHGTDQRDCEKCLSLCMEQLNERH